MGNFFRAPGAKVNYTSYETRNYVSRKARVSRGYHISPTRRDRLGEGWRFWFVSPRGPAADGGNWKVDVVQVSTGGGGGGGGSPGWRCVGGACEYSATQGVYATQAECEAARIPVYGPSPFTGGQCQKPYDVTVTLSTGESKYRRIGGPIGGFRVENRSFDTIVWCLCEGMGNGTSCFVNTGGQRELSFPVFGSVGGIASIDISVPDCGLGTQDNCGDLQGPITGYDCAPGSGGGGGVPPGFLPGKGPWAYACSCPDFAHEEDPYRVATAPSHRRARSWGQIRPLSPCKHIVSAARAIADTKTLVDWVSTFRADSPGTEFTTSPTIGLDHSYNRAQQRLDSAFRRTTRLNRQAVNKALRAQRSQAALMRNLGTVFRLDAYGAYQGKRDNYGVPLNLEALDNRWDLYKSTSPDQLMQGYSNTDTARGIAAYNREQGRIQQAQAEAALMTSVPRQILIAPTNRQLAPDPRFWSASDVGYQIRYEVQGLIRPNYVPTAATLMVGGTGPAGTRRNNRTIQIPNPNPSPGAPRYATIPGTRANSRLYGVSLR